MADTEQFVSRVLEKGGGLVRPILTPRYRMMITMMIINDNDPRFVPSCSRRLMSWLGALSSSLQLPVQTHLAENIPECEWVAALEPDCGSYTEVYNRWGTGDS